MAEKRNQGREGRRRKGKQRREVGLWGHWKERLLWPRETVRGGVTYGAGGTMERREIW